MDAGAEDAVFYAILPDVLAADDIGLQHELDQLRLRCMEVIAPLMDGYVWQYSHFDLQVQKPSAEIPLPFLGGQTRYGHNIDDAWFIVYLLLEISRRLDNISIRVWDTDGEILLIEAAYEIPVWLESETASRNRVFIRQGSVHILPLPSSPAHVGYNLVKPSLKDALKVLTNGNVPTKASEGVQACIARRTAGYDQARSRTMHRVRVRVPLRVAQVLRHEPQMVALAVEAFYRRCQDDLVAAAKMEKFLPKGDTEMVTVVVTLSKAMYAQLKLQVFHAPRVYPMPPLQQQSVEDELGMKIACGFEMMYCEHRRFQDNGEHQTVASLEQDAGWQAFRKNLEGNGYFRDLLEGSREHRELLKAAVERYMKTDGFARLRAAMRAPVQRIDEILELEHCVGDFPPRELLPESDDDSWLYGGEEELTRAMEEGQKQRDEYERRRSGKTKTDETGREVASKMKAFVDKTSSFEGAEVPGDDQEGYVKLDVDKLFHELRSVLGEQGANEAFGTIFGGEDGEDGDGFLGSDNDAADDDDDIDMEDGGATTSGGKDKGKEVFMEEYSDVLEEELKKTSIDKSFDKECGDDMAVDVDLNLVKSLLESYSSQQGLPGPASNLLGLMGLQFPDDSRDGGRNAR